MSLQSQDIIRRSATNSLTPAPQVRDFKESSKAYRRNNLYWL